MVKPYTDDEHKKQQIIILFLLFSSLLFSSAIASSNMEMQMIFKIYLTLVVESRMEMTKSNKKNIPC